MGIKAIFLDIDGVLNAYGTSVETRSKSRCQGLLGIDKDKVQRLAKIVKETHAVLILSSSWRIGWEPAHKYDPISNYHAKYLDSHLWKKGKLILKDKTKDKDSEYRGTGIKDYLTQHPEITDWIVLDDEIFLDFKKQGILSHLVQTNSLYGLTDEDAEVAIKMLKGQIKGPYQGGPHKEDDIDIFEPVFIDVII